ncbi:MAG: ParA family protein [Planctomycetes bacterium]|nr:ParA family protein [Planctomycetota bacterium]
MTTTAVINQKGGVGKTTTVANLGAALGLCGRKVLLLDLDPQANLSAHLGIFDHDAPRTSIYDVLVDEASLEKAIVATQEHNVWVVPSTRDLAGAEIELVSVMGRETRLRDALEALHKSGKHSFDDVLIDCPPSLGLLSLNALGAAERVLLPLQAEFFGLQGYARLMEVIALVQRRLNPKLVLGGIVACKVDRRARFTHDVIAEVRKWAGESFFESMIRPNVKLSEATSHGKSVFRYAADSNGAADYMDLALEYIRRVYGIATGEQGVVARDQLAQEQKAEHNAVARAMAKAVRAAKPVEEAASAPEVPVPLVAASPRKAPTVARSAARRAARPANESAPEA